VTAGGSTKVDSFSGSCALRGTAHFKPPATNQQQRLDVRYAGPATCTGSLNGRAISDAHARVAAAAVADGSCVRAKTLQPGSFRLEFADGTTVRGSYEFDFVGTDGSVTVNGRRSGRASGHGSFANDRTSPDAPVQCATDGLRSAPLDISLTTDRPLVSERHQDRRLLVTVAPRAAVVGRTTRFAFRVQRSGGSPVGGAVVELAGHRARTGPRGRATIVAALPRRGGWAASASKRGFRAGRAEVTAQPPGPLTLEGDCEFSGTVQFSPPLTTATKPVAQRVRGLGTCSGTLTDETGSKHELDAARGVYVASAPAQAMSCNSGTPKGTGAIVLRWGRLDFTSSEARAGAAPLLTLEGTRGGSALVNGAATDDPVTLLQKCGAEGIDKAHLTGRLSATPSISG
jgi:hypothetical protein